MARRAGGGSRMVLPGVRTAVADYLRAFGQHWDSARSLAAADDLDAGRPVEVDGTTVWRAMFSDRYPRHGEQFIGDARRYLVTGPDAIELVDEPPTAR
jgi:hypothetical protein